MPDSIPQVCPQCGARIPADADVCDLCGTPAAGDSAPEASSEATAAGDPKAEGVFCNACGWKNPLEANFCSRCGQPLQDLSGAQPEEIPTAPEKRSRAKPAAPVSSPAGEEKAASPAGSSARRDEGLARRVAVVVGVAVLLITGLFLAATWSQRGGSSGGTSEGGSEGRTAAAAPQGGSDGIPEVIRQHENQPLPSALADEADSLQARLKASSGKEKEAVRSEMVNFYVGAGRPDRAAILQWRAAREEGTAAAWKRAGTLLYDWMASIQGTHRRQVARLTVDAYERVLNEEPGNTGVRANMAVALLETNNPMRGISEIKRVLREEPDHVEARFNYGLMQAMIGRDASAIEQFERVQEIAGEASPYYGQAEKIIANIKKRSDEAPSNAPLPSEGSSGGPPSQ